MKLCCICLRKADDAEPTCVACGEASWGVLPASDEIVVTDTAETADAEGAPSKRRGRR